MALCKIDGLDMSRLCGIVLGTNGGGGGGGGRGGRSERKGVGEKGGEVG